MQLEIEVPEIPPPGFARARAGEPGAAVPVMGPADPGSASPLMARPPRAAITPLMGPAAPATVTSLLGPADRGAMVWLLGPADPGTAYAADAAKPVMPRSGRWTDLSPGPGRHPAGEPERTGHAPGIGTASADNARSPARKAFT